jgi:endonuclease/exonuclease/phosphatase family metal-dependent hydrolase
MPTLRIMTFNVENMLARFNFREWEKRNLATLLDIESDIDRANLVRTHWNAIQDENRVFTALTIKEAKPDVICIQEVENMLALKAFHDRYLRRIWKPKQVSFNHMMLIEGNDPRGIDVAVLSRFRIEKAATHQDKNGTINYPDGSKRERIFRRDCLEVHIKKFNKTLPIFVCHFKSMMGGRKETSPIREAEALTVRKIIEEQFDNPKKSDWVIVGDLNDYTEEDGETDDMHALNPLLEQGFSEDVVKRIQDPKTRWTHYYTGEGSYRQLDYILISPSLAEKNKNVIPSIIRKGQPFRADRYKGPRWPRVGFDRPKASDHCPIFIDLKY